MVGITDRITKLNYEKISKRIVKFLNDELEASGREGYVVGLSGGLDSAVVATLAAEASRDKTMSLILPHSGITPAPDIDDAVNLARNLGIRFQTIDLKPIHSALMENLTFDRLAVGNLLARLRMSFLYYHANQSNCLVVGTSNRSELLIGYFTKFGDGAADMLPLGSLYKLQVRELGRHLKVPAGILQKKSGAMLWAGHTAEEEIGMPYEEVDPVLYCLFDLKLPAGGTARKLNIDPAKVRRIKEMHASSKHKRILPKICKL